MEMIEIENDILNDVKLETLPSSPDWISDDTLAIVLKVESLAGVKESYNLELYGKKMIDYLLMALRGVSIKVTNYNEEDDLLQKIRPFLGEHKYTVVLFSDTPLLDKSTFIEIMEYMRSHSCNVLKLKRGYVFNTEYLKNAENIYASNEETFNEIAFLTANNAKNVNEIMEILHENIINYHISNGVIIVDTKTTFIDADVVIEPGVIIEPNNVIKGLSCIDSEAIIDSGNYIKDCIISRGARIINSYLEECKVKEMSIVGPLEKIINKQV